MDKYYLFDLTDKKISSATINNIIFSGLDLSNLDTLDFSEFVSQTGIKKQEIFDALQMLNKEVHTVYNIYVLTAFGISDKMCLHLKNLGITKLFMLKLYPESLLKRKYGLSDQTIKKLREALSSIPEGVDKTIPIVKEYLESLYKDKEYMTLLKRSILKILSEEYIMEDYLLVELEECYSYGNSIDKALDELSNLEFIECSLFGIKKLQANLKEFMFSLDDKQSGLLKDYLEGVSLDSLSLEYGIPKGKIKSTLKKYPFPPLAEDEYLEIYETYNLSMDDFSKIFQVEKSCYRYLELRTKKSLGKRNVLEMLEDERVSVDSRVRVQNTLGKYAKLHGISVLKTVEAILDIYARFELNKPLELKALIEEFKAYWFSIFHEDVPVNDGKLADAVLQSKCLVEGRGGYRYYPSSLIDSDFYKNLDIQQYVDVELSTKILFDCNRSLMDAYHILDEMELYSLLQKTTKKGKIEFVRKPIVAFGTGNRNNQIKTILFELSPVSMSEFTKAYAKIFGVNEKSFSNYAAKQFSPYYQNGIFTVNTPSMRKEIMDMYRSLLKEEYYFICDIGPLAMHEGIPFQEYFMNRACIEALGYKDAVRVIYKNTYDSLEAYIETLFTEDFNTDTLDKKLVKTYEFKNVLERKLKNFEYFEVSLNRFYSVLKMQELGITKELILDFIDTVKNQVYEDEIFTITSLKNKGITHPIFDLNMPDYFYSKLFSYESDMICQKCYSLDDIILKIRVNKESVSIGDLILQIIEAKYYMYLPDIVKDLDAIYGIHLNETQVKTYISSTDIYCDLDTMLYYPNYEAFRRMR